MQREHIIQTSEVGNWSVWLGDRRIPMAGLAGHGQVKSSDVGRRVWRQAGAVLIESDQQRASRKAQENILSFGL